LGVVVRRDFASFASFAPWRETGLLPDVQESREKDVFSGKRTQ
jgi:hypothetical protein